MSHSVAGSLETGVRFPSVVRVSGVWSWDVDCWGASSKRTVEMCGVFDRFGIPTRLTNRWAILSKVGMRLNLS